MEEIMTLRALFDSKKDSLQQSLEGLTLPRDNKKIQQVISDYLSRLFDSEGEFRQNLTQAEDYLMQAAISLLTAQQELSSSLCEKQQISSADPAHAASLLNTKVTASHVGLGSAAGALIGKITLGGWGAVFGAIAGTAIVVYLAYQERERKIVNNSADPSLPTNDNTRIDIPKFLDVVGGICDSVDNLIITFRNQINRVVDKYESREKPTIEKEYRFLLESIQSLLGYERTHSIEEEKYSRKIKARIEDLSECLENYNLTAMDYTGENDYLFDLVTSPETKEKRMVFPAIVKNGTAVLKGKVFVPVSE